LALISAIVHSDVHPTRTEVDYPVEGTHYYRSSRKRRK